MTNHHRKRKKPFRLTEGAKTGLYVLLSLIIFYIILFNVWGC